MIKLSLLSLVVAMNAGRAHAFQLADHESVMRQAYTEFVACFPKFQSVNVDALVQADKDEDLNLVEKELFYSHYYNPYKKLSMFRGSSADRLQNLAPDLQQCRADSSALSADDTSSLGHALHHLQDMAVPAHVVPVSHSFWDGFESFVVTGDISSEWSCADVLASGADDIESILKETAQDTLTAIQAMNVEAVTADGSVGHYNGTAFWVESGDSSFGSYGPIGNAFGSASISSDQGQMTVAPDAFTIFKRQQMKAAVRATLRGLVSTLQPGNLKVTVVP